MKPRRRVDVNSYFTETSGAVETNRFGSTQGREVQMSSTGARQHRSSDRCTYGTEAVERVGASFTSRRLEFSCESGLPGAMWKTMTRSSGDCGIDPSVQALYPDELSALLTWIETDLDQLPQLGTSEFISSSNRIDGWWAAVETAVQLAGPHLSNWWHWIVQEAGGAHTVSSAAPRRASASTCLKIRSARRRDTC